MPPSRSWPTRRTSKPRSPPPPRSTTRRRDNRAIFRTILILPWVVSQVLAGLLWRWVDSPLIGPVAYVVGQLTRSRVDVLGNPDTAMLGVVVANVWRIFPFPMVLALAALQTVP